MRQSNHLLQRNGARRMGVVRDDKHNPGRAFIDRLAQLVGQGAVDRADFYYLRPGQRHNLCPARPKVDLVPALDDHLIRRSWRQG